MLPQSLIFYSYFTITQHEDHPSAKHIAYIPYNRGSKTRVLQVNVSYTEAKPQWKDSVS